MKYLLIASMLVLSACGQGPAGPQGAQGNPGVPGAPGAPGQSPEIKAFCPDKVGLYAGSYGSLGLQEYYIKLGTNIYAVLDGGTATTVYLTLINAGNYSYQTSDGGNCSFTVYTDGSIIEH